MTIKLILCLLVPVMSILGGITAKLYYKNKDKKEQQDQIDYEKAKEQAIKQLNENCEAAVSDIIDEIKSDYTKELAQLELQKISLKGQIDGYTNQLKQAESTLQARLDEISVSITKEIEEKTKEGQDSVNQIVQKYEQEKEKVKQDYDTYAQDILQKMEAINNEIAKAKAKQDELTADLKRQEEKRMESKFYKIVISEDELADVHKLKRIAEELHDPTIIYKLIYKTYYEKPFSDMVGRVVTGRGSIGVYKITNELNGKIYIGQTKQAFKERWRTHVKRGLRAEPGTQNKLYAAMWEDGLENFTFEVLAECDASQLNVKEKEYIQFYESNTWGYNQTGGNS